MRRRLDGRHIGVGMPHTHHEKGKPMPEMDTPSHTPGTQRGEDHAEPAEDTKGPTDRPVGQVESDPMEPTESAAGRP